MESSRETGQQKKKC